MHSSMKMTSLTEQPHMNVIKSKILILFRMNNKNHRLLAAFMVPKDTFWNNVLDNQGLGDRGSQPQISQDDGD